MTAEVQLFGKGRSGESPAALSVLAEALLREGVVDEAAIRLPDDALPALAHAGGVDPTLPDIILTLGGDELEARVSVVVAQLADPELFSAERHAVLPGTDAVRLFFGLRRLERLSLSAFHSYWLDHHAQIGRRLIPPFSYHQMHADPGRTAGLADAVKARPSSLDGVVEVHFPDIAALVTQLSRAEVAEEALADERNFIDHARSIFWAYETVVRPTSAPV